MRLARLSASICALTLVGLFGCRSSQNSGSSGNAADGTSSSASAAQPAPQQEAPPIVIPAGTTFSVTIDQSVSSKDSQPDLRVAASLADPIIVDGRGVIRRGAKVTAKVIDAKSAGRCKGSAELGITLISVDVDGHSYPIHTTNHSETTKGRGTRTAEGAAIGAGTGAVFGGMRRRRWAEREDFQQTSYLEQQQGALNQGRGNFNQAFSVCMTGRGYTVG